jgi:arylsulfatase A-like enzyme
MKNYHSLLIILIFFLNSCSNNSEQNNPNIIIVLADDLGYGDVSAFNKGSKIITPNLDKMASEGIMFTDAHTSSSVCTPTRYGLLTGRYNWRTRLKKGVLNGKSQALIPNSRTTIASLLKKQGYHTAFIGKWHLGWDWALKNDSAGRNNIDNYDFSKPSANTPNDLGFDYAYGHHASLDMPPYVYVENGMATMVPDTVTVSKTKFGWWRKGPTSKDFIHEDVTPNFFRRSMKYIKERSKNEEPFFLYLALPSPHTPILPTKEWQDKSGLNPYGDFVMMVDDYMGKLAEVIKDEGIENNTLIIFTSDNGCSPAAGFEDLVQMGHKPSSIFRGHKADIYEGGHRVPFIVKWPDKIQKGRISDEIICTTDLLATCAEITGYSLADNEGEDSYSLAPIFENKQLDKSLREATVHHSIRGEFAIRKGDWKLITCPGSGGWSYPRPERDQEVLDTMPQIQLYNLNEDPAETNNLHATNTGKVEELRALLREYILEGRSTPGEPQKNDPIKSEWEQIDDIINH